nr:MAG TPA: hypothetical protein [Herelleviridae sp.]
MLFYLLSFRQICCKPTTPTKNTQREKILLG